MWIALIAQRISRERNDDGAGPDISGRGDRKVRWPRGLHSIRFRFVLRRVHGAGANGTRGVEIALASQSVVVRVGLQKGENLQARVVSRY